MTTADEYLAQCSKYVGWNGDTFNEWCGWPRGTAWCANFHSCVGIRDCGLPWSKNASAAGFASQFPRVDDEDVQPGDMVFFNWDGVQQVAWSENSHVAVVEWFDHDTGYFGVIEGNGNGGICRKTTYYNYSSYFTAFFRPPYVGGSPSYDDGDDTIGGGVVYEVHTADGWLGPVNRVDDTDDGYAGWRMAGIDGIRAYRSDGQPLRIQAIMDNGKEWSWTTFNGSMWGENDDGDGYAGDIDSGHFIIGLRVFGAKCRVKAANSGWLGWTEGDNPTPEGDDFAGEDLPKRVPITAVQMMA